FNGTEGTVIIDGGGWEIIPEPKKNSLEAAKHPESPDPRPAHVRNFLDCMKTRKDPVEHLELGHYVSTVAHLGNLALRSGSEIHWDAENERVKDNREANRLVECDYRKPWKLPYT
ncbi:MAG TPA: gfo/Idh/MocA family oxidoreductase, partial [Candidatus Hydrogenedentes bacterium]|nr:gfo/Idh/MocA family oxidoreductase [Candidatus Hydrogenedentota bacterium]